MRKKLSEKAAKICGTLNDDFKLKEKDKKTIAQTIRLLNANSSHLIGKLKKLSEGVLDKEGHKKYHEYICQLYLSEYIKKSSMAKYTSVYGDASAPLLEQKFAKDDSVDKNALEVLSEVKSRLKTFMDEKSLKSKK